MTIIINSAGLLAGGFPHQMLRLPARSSFNPPVVPGPEHGLGVVGADEGVGAVPSPARVLKLHEHPLPNVLALVVYLGQTVRGVHLTTEEAIDLAVGATAHASSLILLFVLPGPLLKLGLLGVIATSAVYAELMCPGALVIYFLS